MPEYDPLLPTTRKDAYAAGLHKYFTGQACRSGHLSLRYVATGACLACLTGYKKKYARHRGRLLGSVQVAYRIPAALKDSLDGHVAALLQAYDIDRGAL